MIILRSENLVKVYKGRTVVNHVSVEVNQGEIVGLAGAQRRGKNHFILYDSGAYPPR